MRRIAGNTLVVFSIMCMVATALWVALELTHLPDDATEDDRTELLAAWLFTGVLAALEIAMFLGGRYLQRPYDGEQVERTIKRRKRRLLPLAVYLGVSVVAATAAILVFTTRLKLVKPLAIFVFQPTILAQLVFGGLLGLKFSSGTLGDVVIFVCSLLYFAVLLYPLYRMVTMDRKTETAAYGRMKTLLILLGSAHFLIILVVIVLSKA